MNSIQNKVFDKLKEIIDKYDYFCYKHETNNGLLISLYKNVGQYAMHFVKDFKINYLDKNYNFVKEINNIIKFVKENERE